MVEKDNQKLHRRNFEKDAISTITLNYSFSPEVFCDKESENLMLPFSSNYNISIWLENHAKDLAGD